MSKYHNHKLGIAVMFLVIFSLKKLGINGVKVDDAIIPHTTDYRERRDAGDYGKMDGTPNVDFPTYSHVPKTKFSCREMEAGYYADLETDCQVFHICDEGRKLSFLCPNGTVFQQAELICDWWYKVNCTSSPLLYEESAEILQRETAKRKSHRRIKGGTRHVIFSSKEEYDASVENPKDFSTFTTEAFPRKYTSRADRKFDFNRNDYYRNSIEPINDYKDVTTAKTAPTHKTTTARRFDRFENSKNKLTNPNRNLFQKSERGNKFGINTSQNPVSQNSLQDLGIVIGPNHNLPLKNHNSETKQRVSSYGSLLNRNSGETQEVQETASFAMNSRNRFHTDRKTYSNHRESYSEVKDPRQYYQQPFSKLPDKPFYGSSVSPQVLSTVPVTSNFGIYSTTPEYNQPVFEGRFSFSFKSDLPTRRTVKIVTTSTTVAPPTTTLTSLFKPNQSSVHFNALSLDNYKNISNDISESPIVRINITLPTLPTQELDDVLNITETPISTTSSTTSTTTFRTTTFKLSQTTTPIPTTRAPSILLRPKPFSVNPLKIEPSNYPYYKLSSASPFTINAKSEPTQPTTYTPSVSLLSPVEENVNNMIASLMNMLHEQNNADPNNFGTSRPGLMIPPSVGPQTLHTLAIYFANALDNMTSNGTKTTITPTITQNEDILKDLLTQMTRNNYDNLFGKTDTTTSGYITQTEPIKTNEQNLIEEVPNVRVLARVFTEALSAYLEDPETFKRVLLEVRPTEPPLSQNEATETIDEDEVLNYSDSDLKPDHPYLHTTENPVSPTWSYILALNQTKEDISQNSLAEKENLQSADSLSFVSQLNKLGKTTKNGNPEPNALNLPLPNNHWTSSKDVQKIWQNTFSINPADFNSNFNSENADNTGSSADSEETFNESAVPESHYDLRSLPKVQLNSTQVHGILVNLMHNNNSQGGEKLQRMLQKLNISENEFLEKMKEVEENPFTRRLILLLINECNSPNEGIEGRGLSPDEEYDTTEIFDGDNLAASTETNIVKRVVQNTVNEEDEDSRALQLLNSLYVIASKFGK